MSQQRIDLSQMLSLSRVTFVSLGARYAPGFSLSTHRHPDVWQADWVLEGQLSYIIDDRIILIGPGEIGFIPPTVRHKLTSKDGSILRSLKFELPFEFLDGHTVVVQLAGHTLLNLLAREVFLTRVILPWPMNPGYLGALLRLVALPTEDEEQRNMWDIKDPILRAKQFALEHLGEPICVSHMAAAAYLSVSHFSRLFRSIVGIAPIEWLTEKRLLQATQLLRYADKPLCDIAEEVGYADLPSFSKAFKRRLGVTPSVYRSAPEDLNIRDKWNSTQYM